MKNSTKKVLAMLLVFMMAFSVVGCSDGEEPAEEPTEEPTEEPVEEPAEEVSLHLFHYGLGQVDGNEVLAEAFAEATGIEMVAEMVASEHMAVLTSRDAAGNLPDIFATGAYGDQAVKTWVEAGKIQPVEDLAVIKSLPASMRESLTLSDGHIYLVPTYLQPVGVIYNKAIFEANGLEVPETYDEFATVVETLKAAGVTPFGIGARDAWTVGSDIWSPGLTINLPSDWLEKRWSTGEGSFADFAEPARAMVDLTTGNCQPNPLEVDYGGLGALFATEEVAMILHGDWILGDIFELNPEMDGNAGMFPIPYMNEASKNKIYNFSQFYYVSAESDFEAIDEFFSFAYLSDEGKQIYADYFAVPNAYGIEFDANSVLADVIAYSAAGVMTTDVYNVNIPEGFWQNEGLAMQDYIAGNLDPAGLYERLDSEWDDMANN